MSPAELALAFVVQAGQAASLPAESPIGGPFWSYVVPAMLLAAATLGTYLLYRHFAGEENV
jgi:hypothetical protein